MHNITRLGCYVNSFLSSLIIYLRKNSAIGGVFVNTEYSIILCSNISDFDFAEAVFAFYPDSRAIGRNLTGVFNLAEV